MNRAPFPFLAALLAIFAGALATRAGVVINEIHYDPAEKKPLEFIELFNTETNAVDLSGWQLEKFVFPAGTVIAPQGFVVVARDPVALAKAFGGVKALGPMPGRLKHHGEQIVLRDAGARIVEQLRYGAGFPWPTMAAGGGCSLERIAPWLDGNLPGSWRSSGFAARGGGKKLGPTPGRVNSVFATNAPPSVGEVAHDALEQRRATGRDADHDEVERTARPPRRAGLRRLDTGIHLAMAPAVPPRPVEQGAQPALDGIEVELAGMAPAQHEGARPPREAGRDAARPRIEQDRRPAAAIEKPGERLVLTGQQVGVDDGEVGIGLQRRGRALGVAILGQHLDARQTEPQQLDVRPRGRQR